MRTVVPYRIVVPSRRRAHNMSRIMDVLPTCTVVVHWSERAEYVNELGQKWNVVTHDIYDGLGAIRNFCLDTFKEECIVFIDDDFRRIKFLTGRNVRYTDDSYAIERIIENAVNMCADAGIEMFCWTRDPNPKNYKPGDPLYFNGPAGSAFGVIGRKHRFDSALPFGADIDFNMQVLRDSRIVLMDRRYYFDVGLIFTGSGGLQGVRTSKEETRVRDVLRERWKGCLDMDSIKVRGSRSQRMLVQRRSSIVSTRDATKL